MESKISIEIALRAATVARDILQLLTAKDYLLMKLVMKEVVTELTVIDELITKNNPNKTKLKNKSK